MSSRSPQWSASSMTWLETSNVVPRLASWWNCCHRSTRSTGIEADGGLVQHEEVRGGHQCAGQGRARPLTAG